MPLFLTRRLQRLVSMIASFAIIVAVVAPTISQALVATGLVSADWVEICSAQGTRWVNVAEESPDSGSSAVNMGVCAYCFTHAGSFALPPVSATPPVLGDVFLPASFAAFNDPLIPASVWASYQTRAPPPIA